MEENTKSTQNTEFKMPILVGKVGKLPKRAKSSDGKPEDKNAPNLRPIPEKSSDSSKPTTNLPPAVLQKEMSTPIPYKEPKWSGMCPDGSDYAIEVLKSGVIVEKINLTEKPYYVIGRFANSDILLAHPTISRYHAVLQYKAFAEDGEPSSGWYLYDMDSTHFTYLNREKLKPNHYSRVKVGHQMRFGNSTRTYIMLGPDYDCEGESDLTVTEIKQKALELKRERDRQIKEAIEQKERAKADEEKRREEMGIDWGMGEDAEEEPDLADNPFAVTVNEQLYLDDPKKTLRGYFEREGEELTYNCEERGVGQFMCKVELPLDDARGRPIVAEVMHRGKKKDAVVACALEACRVLDRAGLLRQAKHESRRRKSRDWSADDYYDSDEDTFLDRTGSVERKRSIRMKRHGAGVDAVDDGASKALKYEDLLKQVSDLEKKIHVEEKNLERLRSLGKPAKDQNADDVDVLDQFMSNLGQQGQSMAQKAEISQTKMTIQKLKTELAKTQRLADVARPTQLPELVKKDHKKMTVKLGSNSVVYGKRIRLKDDDRKRRLEKAVVKKEEGEFVEEVDSDEEDERATREVEMRSGSDTEEKGERAEEIEGSKETKGREEKERREEIEGSKETEVREEKKGKRLEEVGRSKETKRGEKRERREEIEGSKVMKRREEKEEVDDNAKRVFGPMRPPDNYVIPDSYFDQNSDRDLPEITDE